MIPIAHLNFRSNRIYDQSTVPLLWDCQGLDRNEQIQAYFLQDGEAVGSEVNEPLILDWIGSLILSWKYILYNLEVFFNSQLLLIEIVVL